MRARAASPGSAATHTSIAVRRLLGCCMMANVHAVHCQIEGESVTSIQRLYIERIADDLTPLRGVESDELPNLMPADAALPQRSEAGVAGALGQLASPRIHDQPVV